MRLIGLPVYVAAAAILVQGADAQPRTLTFEQRVRAQESIERFYYAHWIGATRPFEDVVPRATLEKKVRTYLKESVALEAFWKTPVTSEMLHRELERMATKTRMPDRLRELYAVLGNDPFLILECLARPALVDRLARNFFAYDATIHAKTHQGAEALHEDLAQGRLDPRSDYPGRSVVQLVRVEPVEERRGSGEREGPPAGRKIDPFRLELQSDAFDRYRGRLPARVGEIGPVQDEREAFVTRLILEATKDEVKIATFVVPKLSWEEWWNSVAGRLEEELVDAVAPAEAPLPVPQADRSEVLSDPSCLTFDTWDNVSLDGPDPRSSHTAVWTGSLMVVWGGWDLYSLFDTGGRYDPVTDTWSPTSTLNAPSPRLGHVAVWTGSLMVVWGGGDRNGTLNTGGRYDPSTDTWAPISTSPLSPDSSEGRSAVWTGTEMIVWGGDSGSLDFSPGTGGRYNPSTDTWVPTSTGPNTPLERSGHTAIWTGTEMIVWGGASVVDTYTCCPITGCSECPVYQDRDDGGRYDPSTDTWAPISTGAYFPAGRSYHTAVWTGAEIIVWGGRGNYSDLNSGSRYSPATDTWTPMTTTNAPSGRAFHTAVWTGSRMVVWGGSSGSYLSTGARYNPAVDRWTATSTANAPSGRIEHTAVWTGTEMVVWGGVRTGNIYLNTGGRYYVVDPSVDDDTDGVTECEGDCNDGNPAVYAGAAEVCDNLDNDCSGSVDGFATFCGIGQCARAAFCTTGVDSCVPGSPSAEICDSVDNNCDGVVDNASVPVGSASVAMTLFGQTAVLGWEQLVNATGYDVVRGDLGVLLGSGGDFTSAIQGCLANNLGDSALVLSGSPAEGAAFFYLVRGESCGGPGTYDSGDPAQVGSCDAEIRASALSCP